MSKSQPSAIICPQMEQHTEGMWLINVVKHLKNN